MKKITALLLVGFALVLQNCDKDDESDNRPVARFTPSGYNQQYPVQSTLLIILPTLQAIPGAWAMAPLRLIPIPVRHTQP